MTLRHARLVSFLGMDVPLARCVEILRALAFEVAETEPGVLEVTVPTWRVDVDHEVDLIEEVVRVVGYDALPETLPHAFNPTWSEPILAREERARDVLAAAGFVEACTYSFVSAEENAPFASAVARPGSRDRERRSASRSRRCGPRPVIGLLRAARHNVRRGLLGPRPLRGRTLLRPRRGRARRAPARGAPPARPARGPLGRRAAPRGLLRRLGRRRGPLRRLRRRGARLPSGLLPVPRPRPVGRGRRARRRVVGWVGVLAAAAGRAWDLGEAVVADVDLAAIPVPPPPSSVEMPVPLPGKRDRPDGDASPLDLLGDARRRPSGPGRRPSSSASTRSTSGAGPGSRRASSRRRSPSRFGSPERSLSREEVNGWRDEAARRLLALPGHAVDGILLKENEMSGKKEKAPAEETAPGGRRSSSSFSPPWRSGSPGSSRGRRPRRPRTPASGAASRRRRPSGTG